jgi:hypothetical protein
MYGILFGMSLLGRSGLDLSGADNVPPPPVNSVAEASHLVTLLQPVPEAGFGKLTVVSVELIDQFVKPVSHTVSCLPSDGIPYSFVSQAV